jgi:4-amino-4-deoxy-L-arabinose transferase-like glycosyltransferase
LIKQYRAVNVGVLWGICALCILLAAGMLAYPFGYDQGAFAVGGEMILHKGAIVYRDILDTKPPGIFLIYALSSLLFGHHEWSIRALDAIYILCTAFYFYKIVLKALADQGLALTAATLLVLTHVTSGFWMTAQAESFSILPSLVICQMTLELRGKLSSRGALWRGTLAGLAAASLFFLKFTLLTVPLASIVYLFLRTEIPIKERVRFIGLMLGILFPSVCLYLLYLSQVGGLARFTEALQWVSSYSALAPLLSFETISTKYFQLFPQNLVWSWTPTIVVLGAVGTWQFARGVRTSDDNEERNFYSLFFLQCFLALLSVLYERKYFQYHYARALWALIPFISVGVWEVARMFKDLKLRAISSSTASTLVNKTLVYFALVIALAYSPLPRLLSQPIKWTSMALRGTDRSAEVQKQIPNYYYSDVIRMTSALKPRLAAGDSVFFWGNEASVYFHLDRLPQTFVLTNTPLITSWTPLAWKSAMMQQLTASHPRFFISEFGDARDYISGTTRDSYQHLLDWPELKTYVESNYVRTDSIGHFLIFEAKK